MRAVGRRRAVAPKYPPKVWNHYEAMISGDATTTNSQEGWHHRLNTLIGKHHPSFYKFLSGLIDEQGTVDYTIREIELGHNVTKGPKNSQVKYRERIRNIVVNFHDFHRNGNVIGYLRAIGSHLVL